MADAPTFSSWDAVSSTLGNQTSQWLQQQGVPLSQVGSYINQNAPGFAWSSLNGPSAGFQSGGSDPGNVTNTQGSLQQQGVQGSLLNALQMANRGGGGGPSFPNPYTNKIVGNPMYSLSQLGANALNENMIVNPNPAQQPINPQGGVYSGPQMPMISTGVPPAPTGPWSKTPGLMGGPAQVPPPSGVTSFNSGFPYTGPGQINPNYPYGGAAYGGGRQPFGRPVATPPPAPDVITPTAGIQQGVAQATQGEPPPGWGMVTNKNNLPGAMTYNNPPGALNSRLQQGWTNLANYTQGATTPGTSAGSLALDKLMHANRGGSVPGQGNTDTVPAMLTPGEYVLRKEVVQQVGLPRLEAMNRGAPQHFDQGGQVFTQPAGYNPPPAAPQSPLDFVRSLFMATHGGVGYIPNQATNAYDRPPGRDAQNSGTAASDAQTRALETGTASGRPNPNYPDQRGPADVAVDQANQALQARYNAGGSLTIGGDTGLGMDEKAPLTTQQQQTIGAAGAIASIGQQLGEGIKKSVPSWTPIKSDIPDPNSYRDQYNEPKFGETPT